MATASGNGGHIIVIGTPNVTLHCARWSVQEGTRMADISTSAQAYAKYKPVLEDHSFSIELPVDFAATPATAGLTKGAEGLTLYFKNGSSNTYTVLTDCAVESIAPTNDNGSDVHRTTVSGRGGAVTEFAAAPS